MDTKKKYLEQRVDDLEKEVERLRKDFDSLQEKISRSDKNFKLANIVEQLKKSSAAGKNFQPIRHADSFKPLTVPPKKSIAPTNLHTDFSERIFVKNFNRLNELRQRGKTVEFTEMRKDFIRENQVVSFCCENVNERMLDPKSPSIFVEVTPVKDGDFWAVPVEKNKFAVLPNLKSAYDDNYHVERALGEVFDSNFRGVPCERIQVIRPAFFEKNADSWHCLEKGRLFLE